MVTVSAFSKSASASTAKEMSLLVSEVVKDTEPLRAVESAPLLAVPLTV